MKYCKDCKWFKYRIIEDCGCDMLCTCPDLVHAAGKTSCVWGELTKYSLPAARDKHCGEEAKYFEPSFWFKLKSLFSKSNNKE